MEPLRVELKNMELVRPSPILMQTYSLGEREDRLEILEKLIVSGKIELTENVAECRYDPILDRACFFKFKGFEVTKVHNITRYIRLSSTTCSKNSVQLKG